MKPGKLIEAVNEFNQVVKLQEPLKIKKDKDELAKDLYGVLAFIEEGDNFSKATEKVFKKLEKQFNKTVEVGTTVELEVTNNKRNKNSKKMSKKEKKDAKGANVELITALLNPKIKRDEMWDFVKSEKVFKKRKKELLEITNPMSLKSQMLKEFDEETVKEIRATLPKATRKPKAPKIDAETEKLINSVKSATKVKQLKKVAKSDERFNWKKLKKSEEFEDIQTAMLEVLTPATKAKEPAKPKMVANPLIAEIEAFTKTKKLKKWAAEKDEFEDVKIKKSMDIEDAQQALIDVIPAEVEAPKRKQTERRPSNWAERKEFFSELVEKGKYNRQQLMEKLTEKFPGQEKSHSNMLSEVKNEKYAGRYKLKALVVEGKKGRYKFAK